MRKKHKCVIGLLSNYNGGEIVTLEELMKHIQERIRFNEYARGEAMKETVWSLKDYSDEGRSTDFLRFDFCPFCGKKVDWKKIRESEAR